MADDALTLHEAAAELGVHYMTAYRYVRLGQLVAEKDGGTWKVLCSDLDAFRAGAAAAAEAPAAGGRRRAPWAERLESRLLVGDARGAWGVIENALAGGADLDAVYLEVVAPAMASIGDRWERGQLDIAIEHRATGIVLRLIGRLGPRFVRRGRTRGTVVLGAPAGERHSLPVSMMSDMMRLRGWEVSDLGADVPAASFLHAVLTTPDVAAIGISVTTSAGLVPAQASLETIRQTAPDVLLVVGGIAVHDVDHARSLGADALATSADEFVALIEQRLSSDGARGDIAG
jgi:MerR family transcriptional regulator, light-induced transcriptional regulator